MEIEEFPWMRLQGREAEGEGKGVVTTFAWRNQNDCWGKFNRSVVQVKKDVPESSIERPIFRTISQDEESRRAGHHFHG